MPNIGQLDCVQNTVLLNTQPVARCSLMKQPNVTLLVPCTGQSGAYHEQNRLSPGNRRSNANMVGT